MSQEEINLITTAFLAGLSELQARGDFEAVNYVKKRFQEVVKLNGLEFGEEFTNLMIYIKDRLEEVE